MTDNKTKQEPADELNQDIKKSMEKTIAYLDGMFSAVIDDISNPKPDNIYLYITNKKEKVDMEYLVNNYKDGVVRVKTKDDDKP